MDTNILFTEIQQSDYWEFLIIILFALLPANGFLAFQVVKHSNIKKIIFSSIITFMTVLCVVFSFTRLEIEVFKNEIHWRLYPFYFSNQVVAKEEIIEVKNVVYNPKEWGGWGIRTNSNEDKAYTMYGNKGVQIKLKNGQTILLGTQKQKQLYQAISGTTDLTN